MNFIESVKSGYMNMFDFRGRACRSEYWWFQIFLPILVLPLFSTDVTYGTGILGGLINEIFYTYLLILLVSFIASFSLTVRRLHDLDSSGWWYLVVMIPFLGPLYLICLMFLKGTDGPNRFGPARTATSRGLGAGGNSRDAE